MPRQQKNKVLTTIKDYSNRRPFRAPDPSLESKDEALHFRRAQRNLHHRSRKNIAANPHCSRSVREMVGKRKSILFVGTKKQAKAVVQRMR